MHTLTFTFKILSVCGVWLPIDWESRPLTRICYRFFSIFISVALYALVSLQLLLIIISKFDREVLIEVLFTFLTAVSICFKTTNFLMRREKVIGLADMLLEGCCKPRDEIELELERRTNEFIKHFTIFYNVLAQASLVGHVLVPLLDPLERRSLPMKIWMPYDLQLSWNYWRTYIFELLVMVGGIFVNFTTDVLVSGFVLQACAQFDILRHRLSELPARVHEGLEKGAIKETRRLEEWTLQQAVRHHDHIIEFARTVTETFDLIIVEQYIASVLVFSVIVYELSTGEYTTNFQKFIVICYLACMLTEIFIYCWFGNELTLKSEQFCDDIYMIDWTMLSGKSIKSLILIMMRTSRPVVMRYGYIVILNLESFKNILKVTYTAINVLKESADL